MVSVIVPNYNHCKYLKQRLDSILTQTYKNYEIIILDDTSTDDSKNVIEGYRSQVKVIEIVYNSKNSGSVFKQWKKGIELAQGKYIWIAESDDFAEPTFLAETVSFMEKDDEIVLTHVNAKLVDQNSEWFGKTLADIDDGEGNQKFKLPSLIRSGTEELSKSLSFCSSIINASGVLMRTKNLKLIDLNLENYKYAGDWAIYATLAKMGKIAFINKLLSNFRYHTTNTSKKARNDLGIFREHAEIILNYSSWLKSKGGTFKEYAPNVRFKLFEAFQFLPFFDAMRLQIEFFKRAPKLYASVVSAQIRHMFIKRFSK